MTSWYFWWILSLQEHNFEFEFLLIIQAIGIELLGLPAALITKYFNV